MIANQKDYDPLGEGAFAYEEFQHELMAMKSPSQEVVFELKRCVCDYTQAGRRWHGVCVPRELWAPLQLA